MGVQNLTISAAQVLHQSWNVIERAQSTRKGNGQKEAFGGRCSTSPNA